MSKLNKTILLIFIFILCSARIVAKEARYLTGNAADVRPKLAGPAYDLAGGGKDVVAALQWMINQVRGCESCATKLDVVVLRSSGEDGYNELIAALDGVDSVETLVIKSRVDADGAGVGETVRRAEVIFFAGGDQCNYVSYFKGTEVEKGVRDVYRRGGGIGGTSAGLAILGEFAYDACTGNLSVRSNEALANPYNGSMSITDDFFKFAHLQHTITDTHFVARDRMGRTLAFIARQLKDHKLKSVLGIAVDERTSVAVDKKGMARVLGKGPAYFILGDHQPEKCQPNVPLTYTNYKIWKVAEGGTFDLAHKPARGYTLVSVVDGKITSNPY